MACMLRQTLSIYLLAAVVLAQENSPSYGFDCSFPILNLDYTLESCGDLLGNRQALYDAMIRSCRENFGRSCDAHERDRINQIRRQAKSLRNYTATGYDKIRAPKALFDIIHRHWERNKDNKDPEYIEKWPKGYTYVNFWKQNTTIYGLTKRALGATQEMEDEIWRLATPILQEWTGMELIPTSLYGIRVYAEGAILAPHVDRSALISSAIINVAQDQDMNEDWPLEVYGMCINEYLHLKLMGCFLDSSSYLTRPF
jgi:prolyl 4-hydroxylase